MLKLIVRKMIKNKWLVLCLVIGSLLAVSVIGAIPMYSDGILQRMLVKDFERAQEEKNAFPAYNKFEGVLATVNNPNDKIELFEYYDENIKGRMATQVPMDILVSYTAVGTPNRIFLDSREWPKLLEEIQEDKMFPTVSTGKANAVAVDKLPEFVDVVQGDMYTPGTTRIETEDFTGHVYEAVVTTEAMQRNRYSLGGIYTLTANKDNEEYILNYKITGVIEVKEEITPFFTSDYYGVYFEYDTYLDSILNERDMSLGTCEWYYAYDYYQFRMSDANYVLDTLDRNHEWITDNYNRLNQTLSFEDTLIDYLERSGKLSGLLLLLVVPVILMIGFYVTMIAQLIMEQEKNEIAMLESRGAGRKQIFGIYLGESVIIGIIAFILGIFGAYFMTRFIGSSNGFMEFVNRKAIETTIGWKTIVYSAACTILFILMMVGPAIKASKFTIVQFKQGKAVFNRKSFWQKLYLDVVLLAIASYALLNYNKFKDAISLTEGGQVDFLIFFAVTFFILGVSLVFMRIYPYLVDGVFKIGKRFWTPSMYAAFTYVGRSGGMRQFIMIFLILALGVGIFNANSARTINENTTDLIRYEKGTDIILSIGELGFSNEDEAIDVSEASDKIKAYEIMSEYEGVEAITRISTNIVEVDSSKRSVARQRGVQMMAVTPEEFGETVWYREDLYDHHINHYLNLLARYPEGFILSKELAATLDVEPGDDISVRVGGRDVEGPFLAAVEYWPSYDRFGAKDETGKPAKQELVVMHYDNLRASVGEVADIVWIKKKEGVLDSEFNNFLVENQISLLNAEFTDYEVSEAKKDPMLHGMNGILTLDFLVTMIICGAGFIIFWILSIRQRVLQFGIFRAMGLTKRELVTIILWEQILISAVAVIIGILIGGFASKLFVPLFQIVEVGTDRLIPFATAYKRQDYVRIYALVVAMLTIGVTAISRFTTHIKMDQAVKLGED